MNVSQSLSTPYILAVLGWGHSGTDIPEDWLTPWPMAVFTGGPEFLSVGPEARRSLDRAVCAGLLRLGPQIGQTRSDEDLARACLEERPDGDEQPEEDDGEGEDLQPGQRERVCRQFRGEALYKFYGHRSTSLVVKEAGPKKGAGGLVEEQGNPNIPSSAP